MAEPAESETEIAPARAAELWRSAEADLVDVRRDDEWDESRIDGARHIEMNDVASEAETIPRDRPVIFYCRTGSRSALAATAFRQAGWDAYTLTGGLEAWVERGLPLDPPDGKVADSRPA